MYTVQYTIHVVSHEPTGLSRERILRVARDLVAREGMATLSMRRLAQELDVWPMSVYRYFRDKDELLDAIAAAAAADVELPGASAPWRERISALLHAARDAIGDPSGVGSRLPRASLTPEGLRLPEAGLSILADAGCTEEQAASAWRALWSYTFGFATAGPAGGDEDPAREARAAIAALREEDYPSVVRSGRTLVATLLDEAEFERGLALLLDGLEARLRSASVA